jgi:hypothetical protein
VIAEPTKQQKTKKRRKVIIRTMDTAEDALTKIMARLSSIERLLQEFDLTLNDVLEVCTITTKMTTR